MTYQSGRHFLQIPGPTNVPERILRAIDRATIDHRGPTFTNLAYEVLDGIKTIFQTSQPVIIYPSSGTGAWEAALVNTLSPGDRVLMFETGHFATLWRTMAQNLGLDVQFVPGDWRHGVDPLTVEAMLSQDQAHTIRAVMVVHNETSTGVTSRIPEIRAALDRTGHPALLMVDTISSLASIDYRHDEWNVDVTVGCSQKGLMLPPGLGFNAISEKALAASKHARLPKSYWAWEEILNANKRGVYPYTPATNMLYGLREAIEMLHEEGLPTVFARHARLAEATRCAVTAWGFEILCQDPREYSNTLTAVIVPDGYDADNLLTTILENYNLSLGTGLGRLKGKVFRIGHLGDLNDVTLAGTLCGVQMGLTLAGIPHHDGISKALGFLTDLQAVVATTASQ
jgi:alanine-glyoxylate transaminase / serine-glyoxylate transaminase / serine-pyruvate transaminase